MDSTPGVRAHLHQTHTSSLSRPTFDDICQNATDKKVAKAGLSLRFRNWASRKLPGKRFVQLEVGGEKKLAKIANLAELTGLTKQQIRNIASNSESPQETTHALREAYEELTNKGEDLTYLKQLSEETSIPVEQLLEARKQNRLEHVVTHAIQLLEARDQAIAHLEEAFDNIGTEISYPDEDTQIQTKTTPEQLQQLREATTAVVRSAFAVRIRGAEEALPPADTLRLTHDFSIHIEPTDNSMKITGLFGKVLGSGTFAAALSTFPILGHEPDEPTTVVKVPKGLPSTIEDELVTTREAEEQIEREATNLKELHNEGPVLGLMEPVRQVKVLTGGAMRTAHLGRSYAGTLESILSKGPGEGGLSQRDRLSMGYQFLHAVQHMHNRGCTHGDLKPENLFYDPASPEESIGPRLYVADLGDIQNHTHGNLPLFEGFTVAYSLDKDREAAAEAHRAGHSDEYEGILRQADVLATCSNLCQLFTGEMAYKDNPGNSEDYLDSELSRKLVDAGLSESTTKLIIQGFSISRDDRPSIEELFEAVADDVKVRDEELFNSLRALSLSLPADE